MRSNPDVRIKALRKRLETVRGAMLQSSADSIEQSIPGLAEAVDALAILSQEISSDPPAPGPAREKLLLEVSGLRADLSRLAALSTQGLEFCRKWSNIIQSAAGYLPNGEAAPAQASTTILVQG